MAGNSKKPKLRVLSERKYDVCLSFAGENRKYVEKVAEQLRQRGVRIFYDEYEVASLWGKDLYEHLSDLYKNAARFCVIFISKHYARKLWSNLERRSAQARAFEENAEYILPARFDKTPIPGLLPTVGYISLKKLPPKQFAALVVEKLGDPDRENYLPPIPDRLYAKLGTRTKGAQYYAHQEAEEFLGALERMSELEKRLVASTFMFGCPTELPDNIHIPADLLRRITGVPVSQCIRELRNLRSIGFRAAVRPEDNLHNEAVIVLTFEMRSVGYDGPDEATGTIHAIVECLTDDYCSDCATEAILRGDFSVLATATKKPEKHRRSSAEAAASSQMHRTQSKRAKEKSRLLPMKSVKQKR
jgi:hypothetical protein